MYKRVIVPVDSSGLAEGTLNKSLAGDSQAMGIPVDRLVKLSCLETSNRKILTYVRLHFFPCSAC